MITPIHACTTNCLHCCYFWKYSGQVMFVLRVGSSAMAVHYSVVRFCSSFIRVGKLHRSEEKVVIALLCQLKNRNCTLPVFSWGNYTSNTCYIIYFLSVQYLWRDMLVLRKELQKLQNFSLFFFISWGGATVVPRESWEQCKW